MLLRTFTQLSNLQATFPSCAVDAVGKRMLLHVTPRHDDILTLTPTCIRVWACVRADVYVCTYITSSLGSGRESSSSE